jgi:hypothetical protein
MIRRASVPLAATFSLLSGCVDGPVLLDEAPDAGAVTDVDAGAAGTGIIYSDPLGSSSYRWPNAEIHYTINASEWPADKRDEATRLVVFSMARWESLTRIHFIPADGCVDCLIVRGVGDRCYSDIGYTQGQSSIMHLPILSGLDCTAPNIIMHELGHIIGLRHEQQRIDRDNYVTFHPENAADTADFAKDDSGSATEPVGDYDYVSIMNYRSFAHTGNGRMTLTRNDSWGLFDESKDQWRTGVSTPVTQLRVGDFDGDGLDDAVRRKTTGGWEMAHSAQGSWQSLAATDAPHDEVRVGQFDSDPRADLVWASGTSWRYSSGGQGSWTTLLNASTTFDTMRVVDFDGDGDSDFVRILNNRFQVAFDGRAAFQNRPTVFDRPMTIGDVIFGDFVGDARIDALRLDVNGFGIGVGLEVSDGLDGAFTPFRTEFLPSIHSIRPYDADGQGKLDLIRIGAATDPDDIHYEKALGGVAPWTGYSNDGVEDFSKLVIGDFSASPGDEMLVNGYYPGRSEDPTHTDRGGVAHIYYPQVLLSRYGRTNWEYWDDASAESNLAQYKLGDFDGDGLDDFFDVSTSWLTGITSTRYRRMNPDLEHGDVGWHTLTFDVGPAANIAIGQFYGDARMDTFRKNGNWWEVQDGGVGPWMPMMYDTSTTVAQMVFADFDGNGITDIFTSSSGWKISWDGRTQFEPLPGGIGTSLSLLRFGDFTGDGKADVVTWFSNAWWIWSQGSSTWTKLRDETTDIRTLRFGYFDNDNKLDVFRVNGTAWQISSGGTGAWSSIASGYGLSSSAIPSSSLAIGRFSRTSGLRQDVIGFIPALTDDNLNGW